MSDFFFEIFMFLGSFLLPEKINKKTRPTNPTWHVRLQVVFFFSPGLMVVSALPTGALKIFVLLCS